MIILIYGPQYPMINKRCKKVVKSILGDEIDEFSYIRVNAKEVLVQDIVYECNLMPFGGKKVVQVDYPYFLTSIKDKVDIEKNQDYDSLIEYIKNDNQEEVILLFVVETDKLNDKNQIVKLLNTNAKIYFEEGLTIDSLKATCSQYFMKKGSTITQEAIDLLFDRIGDDVNAFILEAEKLSLYKKEIDVEDVAIMVPVPLEQNSFEICSNLLSNHPTKSLRIFRDLLTQKEEPVRILNLLASQFRTYMQVSYLYTIEHASKDQIAQILKFSYGRVNHCCQDIVRLKYSQLCNIMDYLYDLDCKIKGMEVDPVNGIELFIISFNEIKG